MSILLVCVFGLVIESRVTFTLDEAARLSITRELSSVSIESKGTILRNRCGELAGVAYPADLAYLVRR